MVVDGDGWWSMGVASHQESLAGKLLSGDTCFAGAGEGASGIGVIPSFFRRSGVSLAKVFELGHVCHPCTRHWTVYVRAGFPTNQLAAPFVTAL